jgi:hypothetical protein
MWTTKLSVYGRTAIATISSYTGTRNSGYNSCTIYHSNAVIHCISYKYIPIVIYFDALWLI